MASSTNLACFFLLTTLCFSLQIVHARDSQFFSKVSRNRDATTNPNNEYYKSRETENNGFYKSQENEVTPLKKEEQPEEQQPSFIPQTTDTGYGLYGHETGLDAPSITTTTPTSLYNMDDEKFENQKLNNNNNENANEIMHEEKNYVPELKGLSEFSYQSDVGPSKYVAENNYNDNNNNNFNSHFNKNFNNNNDNNVVEEGKFYKGTKFNNNNQEEYYNNNNNNNNNFNDNNVVEGKFYKGTKFNGGVEKQGMSDTRFLENGKYWYDIDAEKNYPNNNYMYYANNYNNNNKGQYYGNRENSHEVYNKNNFNNNNNKEQYYGNSVNNHEEYYSDNHHNNNGQYYGNMENSHEEYFNNNNHKNNYNRNGMQQGYQNQFPVEDEFDFDEQP